MLKTIPTGILIRSAMAHLFDLSLLFPKDELLAGPQKGGGPVSDPDGARPAAHPGGGGADAVAPSEEGIAWTLRRDDYTRAVRVSMSAGMSEGDVRGTRASIDACLN